MNTNRELDRIVQGFLEDRVAAPPRPGLLRDSLDSTATTPQTRRRFLGRWLDRDEGARRGTADHDHPPHSDRRSRLMYSATAITAAVAIAALAVNVVDTTPTQPSAGAVTTHVVAADGTGGFDTIAQAVAAAAAGDIVLVRPGSYVEAIVIDKDITIAGDGPREDIVISAPEDGPRTVFEGVAVMRFDIGYALLLDDTKATVRGLTFTGSEAAVVIDGGSPTLSELVFDDNDEGLLIHSGSTATLTDSLMTVKGILVADSAPTITRSVLSDGASMGGFMREGGVVRDNILTNPDFGIEVSGMPRIEGNIVTGAGSAGISATNFEVAGAPVIVDNTVSGSRFGISVGYGGLGGGSASSGPDAATAFPVVSGNDISAELSAISVNHTDATISDNTIHGSWNGIVLFGSGSAEVTGNEIEVDGFGIDIGVDTSPSVDGNIVCGGVESIKIHESATPSMGENTTCDAA